MAISRQPPQIQSMNGLTYTLTTQAVPLSTGSPKDTYKSRSNPGSMAASVMGICCTRYIRFSGVSSATSLLPREVSVIFMTPSTAR